VVPSPIFKEFRVSLDPTVAKASEKAPEQASGPAPVRLTPTGTQSTAAVAARRWLFAAVCLGTLVLMTERLVHILSRDGFGVVDTLIVLCFVTLIPWSILGFWNSLLGFVLWFLPKPLETINPVAAKARDDDPIFIRTAILMTLRNENPARAFKRLRTIRASLEATGLGEHFDYYVLSDSSVPEVIAAERTAYAAWIPEFPSVDRLVYRHRDNNEGYKAGNVRDFCERWGRQYEVMLPLDADSLMTGPAIVRMVRIMQANPRLGILQSLVVGLPTSSFFARVFQFGMRFGMRTFTSGSAWWHADCGPFWGHNAAVRVAPFTDFCKLPVLPGKPPFGGPILSHDQVEAAMMRRAGFEARVLPREDGSYEDNPPALLDFVRRDLRWCNGNLQYFKIISLPALLPATRANIAMAIQMFFVSPATIALAVFAAIAAAIWPADVAFPAGEAFWFYVVFLAMYFAPKWFGVLESLVRKPSEFGGAGRLLAGFATETLFTFVLSPVSWFNQTMFMTALLFGKTQGWGSQQRDGYRVTWRAAARELWPATAFGVLMLAFLAMSAPAAIPWFLPLLAGLVLSIPFAVFTTSPEVGEAAVRWRLCAIPEEFDTPAEISTLLVPH
jgi:membrane glycosyltransferase